MAIGIASGTQAQNVSEQNPRIGVIGIGRRGFELFQKLAQVPGVKLWMACDVWGPNLDKIRMDGVDLMRTPHYGKVLINCDAVVVAAPDHLHKRICVMALDRQRDIYLETPVTHSLEESTELATAAAKTDRIIQVGHQQVRNPINQKVRELLQSGRIGKISSITGEVHIDGPTRVGYSPIPARTSLDSARWSLFLGGRKRPYEPKHLFHWGLYPDYSCGLAGSEMVPLIATIHTLTGANGPEKVTARGQTLRWRDLTEMPDHLSAILEYPEGFVVNLSVSSSGSYSRPTLVIHGTKGTLEYEPNWCKLLPESGEPGEFRAEGDPTTLHLEAFLESLRDRTKPVPDLAFGINVTNAGHLISLSSKLGTTVGWDKLTGKPIV